MNFKLKFKWQLSCQIFSLAPLRFALLEKGNNLGGYWGTLQTTNCNQVRHSELLFNSTASPKVAVVSPTETFYPVLLNSAHHLNHISFKEQMLR